MSVTRKFTILGCGSSGGVPRLGGNWGACDPDNSKNARRRCSLLVEQTGPDGTTAVLIDTSPDLRMQLLDANIGRLDAVLYTHSHADHVHGIDDLRMIVINMRERLNVWADGETCDALLGRFGYAFVQPAGSAYPPILNLNTLKSTVTISGAGGDIKFEAFDVEHGNIEAKGFRIGDVAYLPDVSELPEAARSAMSGLSWLIIDALRRDPHPSHAHLARTLEWIDQLQPARAVLTNMHIDLDYETVRQETPEHITPAYDGLTIEVTL